MLKSEADNLFQVVEEPNCGPVIFEFKNDAAVPLSYDSVTKKFTLDPSLEDSEGTTISRQAQFYFEDFPERTWSAPIELNI